MIDALKTQKFEDIAGAFAPGSTTGNDTIRTAIHEIGAAVVASAVFASMGGGSVGLPADDQTLDTIPSPLTPIVHRGLEVHRVTELPRLKRQLAEAMEYVTHAADAQMPRGEEVALVRAHLEGALKDLRAAAPVAAV
jgi:hypothetical protein